MLDNSKASFSSNESHHKEQAEGSTIVTVDQGKIYVAKEKEPMPIKLRFALLCTQAGISFAVVAISAYVIAQTPENQNQKAVAWSTLASTLALWLPSPGMNNSKG